MVDAPLRVVFFGTPEFALPTLDALLRSRHQVVGVVTQPDRPRGRGHKTSHAPVKARALDAALSVLQPERLKDAAFLADLSALGSDLGVVAAYGKILTDAVLQAPRLGFRAALRSKRSAGIADGVSRGLKALDALIASPAASLLRDPYDKELLDYYTLGQLAVIDVKTKTAKKIGAPALITNVDASPDGLYFRVTLQTKPYSYLVPVSNFGTAEQLWDANGKVLNQLLPSGVPR